MAKKFLKNKNRARIEKLGKEKILSKKIKMQVIGIGGGAGNIISEIAPKLKKVKFLAVNTDSQALKKIARGVEKFQFGQDLTQGLGTGMNPELGEKAAEAETEKIKKIFKDKDFSILISCLGGGTGSGASPIFAKIANDLKNYSLGIFTLPFLFEGRKRMDIALQSLEKIKLNLNAFVLVPNERIFQLIDQKTPIKEAFSQINKILAENLVGLVEALFLPGVVNIDFADLKTILAGKGKLAFLNTVLCQGEDRIRECEKKILENPLSEISFSGAERILFNISGSNDLKMLEVEKISRTISDFNKKAKIIFGISQKEPLKDSIRVSLLAVGCQQKLKTIPLEKKKIKPKLKKKIKFVPKSIKKIKKKIAPKERIKEKKPEKLLPEAKEETKEFPKEETVEIKTRRNALEIKKELERIEKEILAKETEWESPAFLRKKIRQ